MKVKRFKYDARVLLQTISLASVLKAGAKGVQAAVGKALALALPKPLQAEFLHTISQTGDELKTNRLSDGMKLPSETMIRQYEFSLDLAIAVVTRLRASRIGKVVRFGLVDSSPIGGYDWIWSLYYEIPRDKMIEVSNACNNLTIAVKAYTAFLREQEFPRLDIEGPDPDSDSGGEGDGDDDDEEGPAPFSKEQLQHVPAEWIPWLDTLKANVITINS